LNEILIRIFGVSRFGVSKWSWRPFGDHLDLPRNALCVLLPDATCQMRQVDAACQMRQVAISSCPHEKLLGTTWVSTPATRKDLAARTWGVFWYQSKIPVLLEIMVQIIQEKCTGVETPSPRSFWCGYISRYCDVILRSLSFDMLQSIPRMCRAQKFSPECGPFRNL